MNRRRIGTIGFATAVLAGALACVSPAKADWHHRGHWGDRWHGRHVWVRPPPVHYAPPVVYAPPPVYYPPALSIGVRIR
jgi:hypothetical protein